MKNIGLQRSLSEIVANKKHILSIQKGNSCQRASIEVNTEEPVASSSFLYNIEEERDSDYDLLNKKIYG